MQLKKNKRKELLTKTKPPLSKKKPAKTDLFAKLLDNSASLNTTLNLLPDQPG
jgi:hypothetical protein